MITVRAGSGAIGVCLLLLVAGCSREQQDWRSAESADTIEAYGQFIQRHPESELATQARTRVTQLGEDRDWQHAGSADTVDAYREFIAQHPNGKWAQEARIRIENFSLGEQAGTDAASKTAAGARAGRANGGGGAASSGQSGRMATKADDEARPGAAIAGQPGTAASNGVRSYGLASPGEAAIPAGSAAPRGGTARAASNGGATPAGASGGTAAPPSSAWAAAAAASGGAPPPRTATAAGSGAGGAPLPGSATATGSRPAAAATARTATTGFGIQLGAFSTEASANTEWRLLTSQFLPDLQGLQEHLVAADTASGRIYRLQAVVGDETRARAICDSLRKHGQACVAVLPH